MLAACDSAGEEEDVPQEWISAAQVRQQIEAHVSNFLLEADARGRTPALYQPWALVIAVQDTIMRGGRELCGYGGSDPASGNPVIFIASNRPCWDVDETDREAVVFHELGHALLGREHKDDLLPNGLRASIMYSGNIRGLYSGSRQNRRQYYIDELFDPQTPAPQWGSGKR